MSLRSTPFAARPLPLALLAVVLGATLVAACGDEPESDGPAIEGVVVEDGQDNGHVENPTYEADPPSGGDHLGVPLWLNCGVYDTPVPNGSAVHSLEHGAVWFAYNPDLSADDVATLAELAAEDPDRIIVSPYPDLGAPIVAVAWERRLEVDSAEDPRLLEFADEYVNGAQAPEPGVQCTGGVGQPIA